MLATLSLKTFSSSIGFIYNQKYPPPANISAVFEMNYEVFTFGWQLSSRHSKNIPPPKYVAVFDSN